MNSIQSNEKRPVRAGLSTLPGVMTRIDPKSLAGVLLREHDDASQALRYAERKAQTCFGNMAPHYGKAADDLRLLVATPAKAADPQPMHPAPI